MIGDKSLFEMGYKAATIANDRSYKYKEFSERYPFTDLEVYNELGKVVGNIRIFFQNSEIKAFFDEFGLPSHPLESYNEEIVGKLMGYPPVAVEDYMKKEEGLATIDYHGLTFMLQEKNIPMALDYLERTMPIPEALADQYQSKVIVGRIIEGKLFDFDELQTQ